MVENTTTARAAAHTLSEMAEPIEPGRFTRPVARTFPIEEIAEARRVSQDGHVRGELVLLVG